MSFLYVKAYYGPCNTFNTCTHRPALLNGLRDRLLRLGYRVDLQPVEFQNYCVLEICGHEVFRCNIKHFKFNTGYERDLVCQKAIQAVIESSVKFRRARAYLWFWALLDHQLFRRSKYAPKDYWVQKMDIKTFSTCAECIDCCNIIVTEKKTDKEQTSLDTKASGIPAYNETKPTVSRSALRMVHDKR